MRISILRGNYPEPGGTIVYRYLYAHRHDLDRAWSKMKRSAGRGGGRPAVSRYRAAEAIIWICITRGRWMDLPPSFINGKTAHRTFKHWVARGYWNEFLHELATNTPTGRALGLSRCFEEGVLKRSLAFEEVVDLVQRPNDQDPHQNWMIMLFLSPLGAVRTRNRSRRVVEAQKSVVAEAAS